MTLVFSRIKDILLAERGVRPLYLDHGAIDNGRNRGELFDAIMFEDDRVSNERVKKPVCGVVDVVEDGRFTCYVWETKRFQRL